MEWTPLDELPELPAEETQEHEYKSARGVAEGQKNAWEKARAELQKAASGFWNSGGGTIWFGLGDDGELEEWRFPLKKGKQPIQDWVDQALHAVEPAGPSTTRIFAINPSKRPTEGIVSVSFDESPAAPHMVRSDGFYLRAGAHTVKAPYFMVEALFARRASAAPELMHVVREAEEDGAMCWAEVLATGNHPAFNVSAAYRGIKSDPSWNMNGPVAFRKVLMPHDTLKLPSFPIVFGLGVGEALCVEVSYADRTGRWLRYDSPLEVARCFPANSIVGNYPGR